MQSQTDLQPPNLTETEEPYHKGINVNELIDLRLRGLSYQRVADLVGCSKANVIEHLKPFRDEIEGLDGYKNNRADIMAIHQQRVLKNLTCEKLQKAPANVLLPAFGILYDKERLERSQATVIIDFDAYDKELTELNDEEARLMQAIDITPHDNVDNPDDNT